MVAVLIIFALWFVAGFVVASVSGLSWFRAVQIGLFFLLSALVYTATLILPNEYRKRIFFEGPKPDERGDVIVGLLNALPFGILFFVGIAWLVLKVIELFQ